MRSKKTIAQWLESVKLFPQVMINVRLQPGQDWKSNAKLPGEQAAVEKLLGSDGRVLIRPSGTEPPGASHGRGQECGHGQQLCRASGRGGQGQLKLRKP